MCHAGSHPSPHPVRHKPARVPCDRPGVLADLHAARGPVHHPATHQHVVAIEHDGMREARGGPGDDLGGPVPVEIDLGDMHPAVVGGLERSDLIDLRPGVAVEQADERGLTRRGADGERAGSGGQALLEAVNGGADGRGLPNPSAWLDADPDK